MCLAFHSPERHSRHCTPRLCSPKEKGISTLRIPSLLAGPLVQDSHPLAYFLRRAHWVAYLSLTPCHPVSFMSPSPDSACPQHLALWLDDCVLVPVRTPWKNSWRSSGYVWRGKSVVGTGWGICDRQLLQTLFPIKAFYQNFVHVFNPRTLGVSYCLRKVIESFRTKANILEKNITNIIKYLFIFCLHQAHLKCSPWQV